MNPGFRNLVLEEIFCIFYLEHKTNDWVQSKINFLVGPQEHLLATVKRWKLAWFGHVTRHDSVCQFSKINWNGKEAPKKKYLDTNKRQKLN